MRGARTIRAVLVLAPLCALLAATGIAGVGRGGPGYWTSGRDMHFLYAAGLAWLAGDSPYDMDVLTSYAATVPGVDPQHLAKSGFAYLPQVLPLSVLLTALPLRGATVLMTLLNLASIAVIALVCIRLAARVTSTPTAVQPAGPPLWMFVAVVVLGSPFTSHVLWLGQTSLLMTACILAAWYLARQGREVWAGVILALASSKIQLALLPLLWLALERRARLVVAAVAALACVIALPLWASGGPVALAGDWLRALESYRNGPYNSPSFRHTFSLESSLAAAGIPRTSLGLAAVVSFLLVWRRRHESTDLSILGALAAIGVLFIYAHDYDLVCLTPLFTALWMATAGHRRARLVLLASLAVVFLPNRALRGLDLPDALRWRETVVLAQLAWLWWLCARGRNHPAQIPGSRSGLALPATNTDDSHFDSLEGRSWLPSTAPKD